MKIAMKTVACPLSLETLLIASVSLETFGTVDLRAYGQNRLIPEVCAFAQTYD